MADATVQDILNLYPESTRLNVYIRNIPNGTVDPRVSLGEFVVRDGTIRNIKTGQTWEEIQADEVKFGGGRPLQIRDVQPVRYYTPEPVQDQEHEHDR